MTVQMVVTDSKLREEVTVQMVVTDSKLREEVMVQMVVTGVQTLVLTADGS